MAIEYKVLGQSAPVAGVLTDAYTVPVDASAIISTISIASIGAADTVRVAVRPAGVGILPQHYIVYDVAMESGEATYLTMGIALGSGDVISVYSLDALTAFGIFGSEII